jgi:thioredoxin reductase
VGGGAAGLSAALVLGRARQDVLLVDAGNQSNRPAHAIGGLLAQEGTSPAALYAAAHEQLAQYPSVAVRRGEVDSIERDGDGFRARVADADVRARRVLLAMGMEYAVPDLPGVAERWGDRVFHCPFCHGWEARDGRLALLADGEGAMIRALLLRGWSDDVVLLGTVDDAARAKLDAAGVPVDDRPVAAITGDGATVVFADGSELERDAVMAEAPLRQRSTLAADLGLELTPAGAIKVDTFARTSLRGVFAAGDVAGTHAQVSTAIGAGAAAGGFIRQDLLAAEHGLDFPFAPKPPASPSGAPAEAAR